MLSKTEEVIQPPEFRPPLFGIAILVSAIAIFGTWLMISLISDIYSHEKQVWREKLNLIAESREAEVVRWVDGHFAELRSLAENPSLQLYLSELQSGENTGDESQKAYLRNLLLFTAERGGFTTPTLAQQAIPANIKSDNSGALAIVNAKNEIMVSTNISDSLKNMMAQNLAKMPPGKELFVDIFRDNDRLYAGFVLPIYGIQGERTPSAQMGRVVGLIVIDDRLFSLLKHPGVTEKTLETILVRQNKGKIEYLSPLLDGTSPLSREVEESDDLLESNLINTSGAFLSGKTDYRDVKVIATSRPIARTPWTLIVKIDRSEAYAGSDARRNSLIFSFMLVILVVILTVLAVWWQAYSKRALLQSRYFQKLSTHALAQEKLLRLVADNQPESIYIVDESGRVHFANQKAGDDVDMPPDSMIDKTLPELYGAEKAKPVADMVGVALDEGEVLFATRKVPYGATTKVIRFAFIPMQQVPVSSMLKSTPGVLVVEQDITDAVQERERRMATLRQLVRTLIRLVDERDPFAANHSLLVSELAYQIAELMGLDDVLKETVRIAAKLMNIGKITVPIELLTKTKPLTDKEKKDVLASISSAAKFIHHIDFEGPVKATLEQWQERWDGTGPLGLRGEDILLTARIIAPANAFIGMVSPRSWRDAMTIEAATQYILTLAGGQFDRNVIVAMIHYIENHHGGSWIRKVLESAKGGSGADEEDGKDTLI